MHCYRLSIAFFCAIQIGCSTSSPIPSGDGTVGYDMAEFKDDAPANASVSDFPRSFVDATGRPVDLNHYLGKKVVLVVLRGIPRSLEGAFCPNCLAQTSGLIAKQSEFDKRGVEVLILFPGPSERVGEFMESARRQTSGEPFLKLKFLLDQNMTTCDRLGIRGDLAKPSTYILDSKGHVIYAYIGVTTTDRPSVKGILAQLDRTN